MAGRNFNNFVSKGAVSYSAGTKAGMLVVAAAALVGCGYAMASGTSSSQAPRLTVESGFQRAFGQPPSQASTLQRYDSAKRNTGIVCIPRSMAAPDSTQVEDCDHEASVSHVSFAMR